MVKESFCVATKWAISNFFAASPSHLSTCLKPERLEHRIGGGGESSRLGSLLPQEQNCMTMLITLGMVTNVAYPHRVGFDDPLVAEVLTQTDSVSEIDAHFTLQLVHHLLPAVHLTSAEKP